MVLETCKDMNKDSKTNKNKILSIDSNLKPLY